MACANACPKGAIDIGINKYGYEKVVIDNGKCVDCGLCAKVCARRILLFLIFSTITIEKSQMHSSEFGGYTSSSCVF